MGYNSGSSGTYSLIGGSISLPGVNSGISFPSMYVGYSGTGTFTQTGGTNAISSNLYLGSNSSGNGTYNVSGGSLSTGFTYVGYSGTGTFTQSGGTNSFSNLYLGYNPGSSGTYSLSNTGQLSAVGEFIGYNSAAALFQQTGGTNTAMCICIGGGGTLQISGGTLQVSNGLQDWGRLDLGGCIGGITLVPAPSSI